MRSCLGLGMAKQLADHRKAETAGVSVRGKGVAQVVGANILKACAFSNPPPGRAVSADDRKRSRIFSRNRLTRRQGFTPSGRIPQVSACKSMTDSAASARWAW